MEVAGKAWDLFIRRYQGLIVENFEELGLTLPIDSSCDDELSAKKIRTSLLQIGDWGADRSGESRNVANALQEPAWDQDVKFVDTK